MLGRPGGRVGAAAPVDFAIAGIETTRVTEPQLRRDADGIAAKVADLLGRRGQRPV